MFVFLRYKPFRIPAMSSLSGSETGVSENHCVGRILVAGMLMYREGQNQRPDLIVTW
jgi:hypothetical protein